MTRQEELLELGPQVMIQPTGLRGTLCARSCSESMRVSSGCHLSSASSRVSAAPSRSRTTHAAAASGASLATKGFITCAARFVHNSNQFSHLYRKVCRQQLSIPPPSECTSGLLTGQQLPIGSSDLEHLAIAQVLPECCLGEEKLLH